MLSKISLKILLFICVTVIANEDGPEVTIKYGKIKGEYRQTKPGKTFSAFTGIPYAKPPVGDLRLKGATPPEPWKGTLDATKPHAVCPQPNILVDYNTIIGDEDCLYLNIYTPQLPDSNKNLLPVLFYIHGGGFVFGSANLYVPDLLVSKDIVVVTINYRLGPLGFLATGTHHALGNEGLKDQVAALRWTKENIAKFGGDPERITVAGQSAGGASAHYLMLSPLSKDLIKGVIAQSGTALANWALMPHFLNGRRTKMLAARLGCDTYDINKMVDCLIKAEAYDIIKETDFLFEWDKEPMIAFKPVIEPRLPNAFLPEDPLDIIISGNTADVPILTGLTRDEGVFRTAALFKNPDMVKEIDQNFSNISALLLMYSDGIVYKHRETIAPEIRKFYFGDKPIDESTKSKFTDMVGDAVILTAEDVAVELHAKYSKQPIYYYLFGYRGSHSFSNLLSGTSEDLGVSHSDDLFYLFNSDKIIPGYELSKTDEKVAELMTTLWANFVKYGHPTPEEDKLIAAMWEPVQRQKQNYYYIKGHDDVQMAEGLYAERAEFWRNLKMNVRTKKIRDEL